MRLENKIAIITGAGSGMGKAMAQMLRRAKAPRSSAPTSAAIRTRSPPPSATRAVGVHANVAEEDDVRNMIATAEQKFGRLDILVNNAGFGGGMAPLHEQTTENWDRVHSVNIRGVFFGMKYGIISMLRTGGGNIVNITSARASSGWKHHSIYGAAKAGVNHLTKTAALDYADAQHPRERGRAGHDVDWAGPAVEDSPNRRPGLAAPPGIPMDRWGLAREIAAAALFLASDDASFITGVVLPVDGGYCIGYSGMGAEHTGAPGTRE